MRATVLLLAALLGVASAQRCRQVARTQWVGFGTGGDIAAGRRAVPDARPALTPYSPDPCRLGPASHAACGLPTELANFQGRRKALLAVPARLPCRRCTPPSTATAASRLTFISLSRPPSSWLTRLL